MGEDPSNALDVLQGEPPDREDSSDLEEDSSSYMLCHCYPHCPVTMRTQTKKTKWRKEGGLFREEGMMW